MARVSSKASGQVPELDLSDYLPYLVNRVGAALVADFTARALAAEDLSIAMWRVLAVLANRGALRQVDVSQHTSIDVSTLSRLVARLVRRGLVTRVRSATDNREVTVALSPQGRALVRRLIPVARELEWRAVGTLPEKELVTLRRTLRTVYGNLVDGAQKPR